VYVPAPDSVRFPEFARAVGEAIAQKLSYEFGETQVCFPRRLTAKRDEIIKLRAESLTALEIARRLGTSESYVCRVLAKERTRLSTDGSCQHGR
jgi:DNA-binding NarL/FixJ family response regulator